jgi:hypothetical protein
MIFILGTMSGLHIPRNLSDINHARKTPRHSVKYHAQIRRDWISHISRFFELHIKKERRRKMRISSRGFAKTVAYLPGCPWQQMFQIYLTDVAYQPPAWTPSSTSTIDNRCTDNPLLNRIHLH